jgi:hypothetical protein
MAILIYFLEKKYRILSIDNNDRKKYSRKHFVNTLTNKNHKGIQGINFYFEAVSGDLKRINENDISFKTIKNQLDAIVSNC